MGHRILASNTKPCDKLSKLRKAINRCSKVLTPRRYERSRFAKGNNRVRDSIKIELRWEQVVCALEVLRDGADRPSINNKTAQDPLPIAVEKRGSRLRRTKLRRAHHHERINEIFFSFFLQFFDNCLPQQAPHRVRDNCYLARVRIRRKFLNPFSHIYNSLGGVNAIGENPLR